jgi:ABC-type multidrug transport system fused ATPase/permease subunit
MTAPTAPTAEAAPTAAPQVRRYGALLGRYLAPQRGPALLLAVLLLAGIGLQLAVPQVLRTFIDTATGVASGSLPAGAGTGLAGLAGVFLALALGTQVLGGAATVLGASVGWNATNLLRRDLLDHCLRLDMTFHAARTSGEMIERVDGDVTALSDFFAQFAVRVLGGLLLLAGILVLLWLENPWLGAALTLFTALEVAVMVRLRDVAVPASAREREAAAQVFGFVEERLTGIDDVRANGAGAHALHRFVAVMRTFFVDTRRAWMARSIVWLSTYGLFVVGVLVTIGSGIQLVLIGAITLGTAYMVFQYLVLLQAPIEQITQQMQVLQRAGASLGRIDELLRERSRLAPLDAARAATLPAGPLEVRFEGVGFRYHDADEGAPPNLRDVDLTVAAGTHLGLLGRTGSGKTTLTRLAFRFYDPDEGRVVLGGVDARDVPLAELRRRVGLVTQEVQLVQGSVRDNLTFFDATVPDARLRAALDEVGLGAWLAGLPAGLDTPVHAGGGNLSAGEAQLLAMARVFLGDPGVVLLDEPSSRLDPATERRLELALERLLRGRTAVIIAHRLDTVDRVDAVAVLDDGAVIEHGPRAALAADPATRYARLLRAARGAAPGVDAALEELA